MRAVPIFLLSFATAATAAVAAPPAGSPASDKLRTALQAMMAPGQQAGSVDRDQGDDHASLRAITEVCSHDNPSAQRSAICPVAVSPF